MPIMFDCGYPHMVAPRSANLAFEASTPSKRGKSLFSICKHRQQYTYIFFPQQCNRVGRNTKPII